MFVEDPQTSGRLEGRKQAELLARAMLQGTTLMNRQLEEVCNGNAKLVPCS